MYCTAAIGYVAQGLLTAECFTLIVAVVPGMILGYWLSVRLTGRMNEKVFRQAVVSIIAVASILVLVREILPL